MSNSPISNRSSTDKLDFQDESLEKPGASTFSQDTVFDDPLLAK